ncbi:nucleoside recognition domain-containing protein [Gracilibacillus sp. S3-1-1]|uniref:Nucleoside recognition domain-containing protein n=1 Tax=Gracilibacillus pellucidus TaxID=3095368 RepID=A0ACC6M5B7_9BACI|nr:nucleoside recognition domain-containing protein [Gracilibacillus sp. S3-1-1]MDX8046083.1 nucleoside recognition domain-containing protein [Gracilibacillus sp. S3-1-1]
MINIIWALMAIIGIIYAMFNGTMEQVNEALFSGASEAVTLVISLSSVLIFWLGMMRIAERAGILKGFARICRPVVKRLFPEIPDGHPAMGYILANFSANLFGLGNAATPMGIKAMEEMKKISQSDRATNSMITFLVINTSSITLVPTTVIAIRMQYGSAAPTEIVASTILATMITTITAITIDRLLQKSR